MALSASNPALLGRREECRMLDHVVSSLRGGQSRSLVIRAEAGMGKSALLDYLDSRASGCRVVKASGVESEIELAYAGLHQLCAPLLDQLGALAAPQAAALEVALGLRSGEAPDRFLVGLAVLNLLSASAVDKPLLGLVDDAQWLDLASRQTLAFVARRLMAESVGLVFAVREPNEDATFAGIESMTVTGLDKPDARRLLESVVGGPMDVGVRDRVIEETRGNPLALTELVRGRTPAEIAGGFELSLAPTVGNRIEDSYLRRITSLPEESGGILVVAALEPVGDAALVIAAAERLGLSPEAFTPAIHAGLVDVGVKLRFRHPLMRSATIRMASPDQLLHAHRALAETTDPDTDPDRRAWHRAEATVGFDEDVAAELVRSARRAQSRGGLAAGAAFHQRAVELTPDPRMRSRRALMAAEDKYRAGAVGDALRLLDLAEAEHLDDHQQARAELVRARIAHAVTRGKDAPRLLVAAAQHLQPHDPEASLAIYADAFAAAMNSGDQAVGKNIVDVAEAILAVAEQPDLYASSSLGLEMLRGLAVLAIDGYGAAAPRLRHSLGVFVRTVVTQGGSTDPVRPTPVDTAGEAETAGPSHDELRRGLGSDATANDGGLRWIALGCLLARILSDDVAFDDLTELQLRVCRETGALTFVPNAMADRIAALIWKGDVAEAATIGEALGPAVRATGLPITMNRNKTLAALWGDEETLLPMASRSEAEARLHGEGTWLIMNSCEVGVLFNGLGRYEEAYAAMENLAGHPFDIGLATWVLPEVVEAAVRTGNLTKARETVARLSELADACGTGWALGVAARCAAQVSEGAEADALYNVSIDELSGTRIRMAEARSRLVHGEWLRRENRRVEARDQLRIAYEMFVGMGVHGFAERARRELFATGEVVRRRGDDKHDDLTAQERQIALLAARGETNPEIGAELYLSPRTVEWHLRKVFTKLGVSSRRQLAGALGGSPSTRAS